MAQHNKICRFCNTLGHSKFYCKQRPNKVPKQQGKHSKQWQAHRAQLMQDNTQEWFTCWICNKLVHRSEVTWDHVIPRSGAPQLRYDNDNIKPAHGLCNGEKGSKRY